MEYFVSSWEVANVEPAQPEPMMIIFFAEPICLRFVQTFGVIGKYRGAEEFFTF